jgi:hypothetical protein
MTIPSLKILSFKALNRILFSGLFLYLLLRSILVAPLHDETATYFHFIETGTILGSDALPDANNHLLNSLWGRWMYELFGNHFALFRLGNVLAFIPYFLACVSLSGDLRNNTQRFLFILALTTVPYLLDYFSAARGYGMAIGFFFAALALLRKWLKTGKTTTLGFAYLCMFLSVFSNLIFLVSALLFIFTVLFFQLLKYRQLSSPSHIVHVLLHIALAAALYPLIQRSLYLKEIGALYYGSLDGFWNVTGKSLSSLVVFRNDNFLQWLYVAFALLITLNILLKWRKEGLKKWSENTLFVVVLFIAGNVFAVLFMAKFMLVNYPEDRAGIYFVPLGIAAFSILMLDHKRWRYTAVLVCFFPVSLLLKMNVHTSVFSPDDRMSSDFYQSVRNQLKPTDVLSIDPIQQLNWARFEQLNGKQPHPGIITRTFFPGYDIIVTKTAFPLPDSLRSHYTVIANDEASAYVAYRRKTVYDISILRQTTLPDYSGRDEKPLLLTLPLTPEIRHNNYRIVFEGTIETSERYRDLVFVIETENSEKTIIRNTNFNFRWYYGAANRRFRYSFQYGGQPFSDEEAELKVYIWNPEKRFIRFRNSSYKWSLLKTQNNGTR